MTLKLPKILRLQVAAAAKRRGVTQSELVRQAIEKLLRDDAAAPQSPTPYDLIRDLIEKLPKGGPKTDRSTNKKYMEGYGLDGPEYRKWLRRARRTR